MMFKRGESHSDWTMGGHGWAQKKHYKPGNPRLQVIPGLKVALQRPAPFCPGGCLPPTIINLLTLVPTLLVLRDTYRPALNHS